MFLNRLIIATLLAALGGASGCAGISRIPKPFHGERQKPLVLTEDPDLGPARLMPLDVFAPESCEAELPESALKEWRDYTGVLHVHTRYSHDADGRFEDVVSVAQAQQLDFVAVTEHNTLQPLREGRMRRYGETLILIGMEISTRGGHYLTFNATHEVDRSALSAQEVIDAVAEQGGFGFIAHPYFKQRAWLDWSVRRFTGMEIYNASHDVFDEPVARLAFWTMNPAPIASYLSVLKRPAHPLKTWDELIRRHGRVVGIGSVDAHEVHAFGMTFAPYEAMFQMARTHILSRVSPLSPGAAHAALKSGHAYVSIDLLGEPGGFIFRADAEGRTLGIMGDAVPMRNGLMLVAESPAEAQATLYRDGLVIARSAGRRFEWNADRAGVYRVEVSREGKPWIFSNPIYID